MSNPLGVRIVNAGAREGLAVIDYDDATGIRVRWERRRDGGTRYRCTECKLPAGTPCGHVEAVRHARQAHDQLKGRGRTPKPSESPTAGETSPTSR